MIGRRMHLGELKEQGFFEILGLLLPLSTKCRSTAAFAKSRLVPAFFRTGWNGSDRQLWIPCTTPFTEAELAATCRRYRASRRCAKAAS